MRLLPDSFKISGAGQSGSDVGNILELQNH